MRVRIPPEVFVTSVVEWSNVSNSSEPLASGFIRIIRP